MNSSFSKPSYNSYDLALVGGGIVGLATAREFLLRQPGLRVIVLEKEPTIATHQSGHNSGVIHTGIYYAPGSLKARACVEGHQAIIDFCQEQAIPFELCGKVIVALDETELPRLEELYRRGVTNGVQGLKVIGPERLRELEPYAVGLKAIYSPNTGIVDYIKVAQAYARQIEEWGGEIVTNCEVVSLATEPGQTVLGLEQVSDDQQTRTHRHSEITARFVITCGGLYSDKLSQLDAGASRQAAEEAEKVKIVPFRGDYYVLSHSARQMVRGMIYPVPDPEFPFLGVHFTKRMDGAVWAGPNAVLAFAREGYGRWDIRPQDLLESLTYSGFRKLALRYWKTGLAEMYRDYNKAAFFKSLQRYMPALKSTDLEIGPSGVRAQALAPDGRLVDDFLIRQGPNIAHVQNAPSPAATSSMIIARMIADQTQHNFDLSATVQAVVGYTGVRQD